jgi:hypothetical protein
VFDVLCLTAPITQLQWWPSFTKKPQASPIVLGTHDLKSAL